MTTVRMIAATSLLALAAGTASAATMTQNFDLGPGLPTSGTATFNQFDSAQGTLTGVTLTLGAGFLSQLWVEATTGQGATAHSGWFADSLFRFASDVFDQIEVDIAGGTYGNAVSTGIGDLVYGDPSERAHTVTLTSASGLDLSDFIGGGQFDVFLGIFTDYDGMETGGTYGGFSSGGNQRAGIRTDHSLSASLTYDFAPAPVPLPAAGLLLLAAVGGLGAMARRRASASA